MRRMCRLLISIAAVENVKRWKENLCPTCVHLDMHRSSYWDGVCSVDGKNLSFPAVPHGRCKHYQNTPPPIQLPGDNQ